MMKQANMGARLYVHSVFESISGEAGGFLQGTWCTFIRLAGCNLRCHWCDTQSAQNVDAQAKEMTVQQLCDMVAGYGNKHVLITGGEPLTQITSVVELLFALWHAKHRIQIETNGSILLPEHTPPVKWVVDHKCPLSGEESSMIEVGRALANFKQVQYNGSKVFVKWVIGSELDLEYAIARMDTMIYYNYIIQHILSPMDADGSAIETMVNKIKKTKPEILDNVTFSVQMHKIFDLP